MPSTPGAMRVPDFFDAIPAIRMHDPLAGLLGAVEGGLIEYRYIDAVKLAGHSCPTVAAAWQLTRRALAELYDGGVPVRGAIRVEMRGDRADGVVGVIANVAALITGASGDSGFKGIAGHFDRRNLLAYGIDLPEEMRFTRTDTGAGVDASADLRHVPGDPSTMPLLQRCVSGSRRRRRRGASENCGRRGCAGSCSSMPTTTRCSECGAPLRRTRCARKRPDRVERVEFRRPRGVRPGEPPGPWT